MKKILILILISVIVSCNSDQNDSNLKLIKLQKENDSLKSIIDTLNSKYIFDNIKVRFVGSEKNENKLNSEYNGEFVIIAYSKEDKIEFATELEQNQVDFKNSETLKRDFGGYPFKFKMKNKENEIYARIVSENKLGKDHSFGGVMFVDLKTTK